MIEQPYDYYELMPKTHYIFESVGAEKSVFKIVQFSFTGDDIWNLGFGDLKDDGFVDGSVITNNQDAHKVLRTVAKIAIDFLAKYPNSTLEIKPVDEKRKRLYNNIFRKYVKEIEPLFNLIGTFEGKKETYSPLKSYDTFQITFK
jgi:hypothetical protein